MGFDYVFMPATVLVFGISIIWLSYRRVLSLSGNGLLKWIERTVLWMVILLAVVVTASTTFNAITIWSFHPHDRPPGDMFLVDNHKMHIDCTGSGSPTIVLESGLGGDWLIWSKVQPALSRTTRVCSYDRAGYGYSAPQPSPRDADHVAKELHGLLAQAQVTGPFVLMGHSLGGLFVRDYAARYPEEIAGLVFVDASSPLQGQSPALRNINTQFPSVTRLFTRLAFITNTPRLVGACSWPKPGSDPSGWRLIAESLCHPQYGAWQAESDSFGLSATETLQSGQYGARPILILSRDPGKDGHPAIGDLSWDQMQEGLKKLSTRSLRIVATGSGHYVQLERPDVLNKEVLLFIEQIRGSAPQPTNYGSTITE